MKPIKRIEKMQLQLHKLLNHQDISYLKFQQMNKWLEDEKVKMKGKWK